MARRTSGGLMGFFDYFRKQTGIAELQKQIGQMDVDLKTIKKDTIELKAQPRVNSPVLGYTYGWAHLRSLGSRTTSLQLTYQWPEYDLSQVARLEDTEAYVMQGNLRKQAIMFKQGYNFVGKNPETVNYIKQRLFEIDHVIEEKEEGVEELIMNSGGDLIRYSNAFWIKIRDKDMSSGRTRTVGSKTIEPIAAYFRLPPETMKVAYDEKGKAVGFQQYMADGRTLEFKPDQIIHFRFNRKRGLVFGTPILAPVFDDVKALREIEENIEILLHQHIFPLFQFIVGTETSPATTMDDGTDEIQFWQNKIQHLPAEGCVVTSERQKIEVIGAEGEALKAKEYLEYFRDRVFGGMGMSSVDFGISGTSNRNTSSVMSQGVIDSLKLVQKFFEIQFNRLVVRDLLAEGPFSNPYTIDNQVQFRFNEIDLDALIKIQNHAALMYQGHTLSEIEVRTMMGYAALEESDRENMYLNLVEIPLLEKKSEGQMEVTAARASMQSKQQPSNQHKTNPGPTKRQSFVLGGWSDNVADAYDNLYQAMLRELQGNKGFTYIRVAAQAQETQIAKEIERSVRSSFQVGLTETGSSVYFKSYEDRVAYMATSDVHRLVNDLVQAVSNVYNQEDAESGLRLAYDAMRYRAALVDKAANRRAYIYGKALGFRNLGVKELETVPQLGSTQTVKTINAQTFSIGELPPVHPRDEQDIKPKEQK